ncbi:MAG: hypothetical protein IJH68_07430 [Thermoguttaceae bacterium]|nr:hypothetical protein [Thermoguttaceae bacterium]
MSRILSRVVLAAAALCLLGAAAGSNAADDDILRPSHETKQTTRTDDSVIPPRNSSASRSRSQDFDGNPTGTPSRSLRDAAGLGSSLDDDLQNRPPEPVQKPSNNLYPQGFLTMSTPSAGTLLDDGSSESETASGEDSGVLLATMLGLLIFGIFTWSDYRYRQVLQSLMAKNRRILGGEIIDSSTEAIASPWEGLFPFSDSWFPWFRPSRSDVDLSTQIALLNDDPKL